LVARDKFHASETKTSFSHLWILRTYPISSPRHLSSLLVAIDRQLLGHLSLSTTKMKIAKAPMLLKKAAAMCKSKTGVLASRLLLLASLQRRRMAAVAVISHKIHALVVDDRQRVDCQRALVMRKVENRQADVHGVDRAADISDQLALFDEENGYGVCPDWTLHPIFSDGENCHTDEWVNDDDGDVLVDACHTEEDDEVFSVIDVIRSNREVEGLEFNMEEEIDQAADMFIRRFRQRLNESF
jgi:hypothetical protein